MGDDGGSGGSEMQVRPVSRPTAEHYPWGEHSDGWHLVKDERPRVIEEQMPPGTAEVFHHQVQSQQFCFILSGDAVIEVDGSQTRLLAHQWLRIPPGIRPQIRKASKEPVQRLVISQPPAHRDRVIAGRDGPLESKF